MSAVEAVSLLVIAALLGFGAPWATMAMLVPALEESTRATALNYRGWRVFHGLGIVWLIWSGAAMFGGIVSNALAAEGTVLVLLALAGPLALVSFALGLFDDAYGTSSARGFRGHLRALSQGRLTTGGLKLFGISAASYVVAVLLWDVAAWGGGAAGWMPFVMALPAGAAIALTSNLLNLTDLRPGRALKTYSALVFFGVASVVLGLGTQFPVGTVSLVVDAVSLLIFALGPVFAVWRYDVREWGMLGDAGANPMGAVAGLFIVAGLPPAGMFVYLIAVLALNVVSERVSFSSVIERSALLSRIDAIGRLPETSAERDFAKSNQPPEPPAE